MKVRVFVGVMVVGWCLTPSGSIAGTRPEYLEPRTVCTVAPAWQPDERSELTDDTTGAQLLVTARPGGALQVRMTWPDFDFRKVIQPNGDFTLLLTGGPDVVVLIQSGDKLRVTRNGNTAVLKHSQPDDPGLERAQQVLAGSRAMRMFRTLRARLSDETLASIPGVIVDVTEVQVGVLQGDGGVLERRRMKPRGRVARASLGGGDKCWSEYENELNIAWSQYADCVNDARWYPGGPEVCAFVWSIRVEGVWFSFLNCVAFTTRLQ